MTSEHCLLISGLFTMPHRVREHAPSHLVSILQAEFQPDTPPEIEPENHLRVAIHDIAHDDGVRVLAQRSDMVRLLDFLEQWEPSEGGLLTHCYAGVSRSSATALIGHLLRSGDAERSVLALRQAAPHALPNRRLVALADDELGYRGKLVAAVDAMRPGTGLFGEEGWAVLALDP